MSGLAKSIGVSATSIEHEGRTYTFRELDIEGMAKHSTFLEERGYRAIERQQYLPDAVRERMAVNLTAAIAAGDYEPGGRTYVASMVTVVGMAHVLWLGSVADGDSVTLEECERVVRAKFEAVAAAELREMTTDPKASSADPEGSPPGPTS